MNTTPPLLPETRFQPLSQSKLNAMIDTAVSHRQLPRQATVINLANWRQRMAFGTGLGAMAASIMLAFMFTPQYGTFSSVTQAPEATALTADLGDLLFYDSLGA